MAQKFNADGTLAWPATRSSVVAIDHPDDFGESITLFGIPGEPICGVCGKTLDHLHTFPGPDA